MLLSAKMLLGGLRREFEKLQFKDDDSNTPGSSIQIVRSCLNLLETRERSGAAFIHRQLNKLEECIDSLSEQLPGDTITSLKEDISRTKATTDLNVLEEQWREILSTLEKIMVAYNKAASFPGSREHADFSQQLIEWEVDDLLSQASKPDEHDKEDGGAVTISKENLTVYLRDRFSDPGLEVTDFRPLPGGFGKQTILFSTESASFPGSFVMRRDPLIIQCVDNDCHRVRQEYPVIVAMHKRGFPAPEALWLDTEHPLLPGGDFIIMRRAPGVPRGDIFGAKASISDNLVDILADIMAKLHTLPPLTELGALTSSIQPHLWQSSMKDCVHQYISYWYEFYINTSHIPSPAIVSAYGWLLNNIPDIDGTPVFLHGDIGFHNFLFDDGELSAVVDWEFAHIGDPAEDLGYVKNTVGQAMDWGRFMEKYYAAGGPYINEKRLAFFQAWGALRNSSAANMALSKYAYGSSDEMKLACLLNFYLPHYLREAGQLMTRR